MAEITISTEETEETEPLQLMNNASTCCEHCVQHAERIVQLEAQLADIDVRLMQARGEASQAIEVASQAIETSEAAAIVALETAIEQETEEVIDESGHGGPESLPDEQPGLNNASGEKEPTVISVEPEKEPEKEQPAYGFRRGKH